MRRQYLLSLCLMCSLIGCTSVEIAIPIAEPFELVGPIKPCACHTPNAMTPPKLEDIPQEERVSYRAGYCNGWSRAVANNYSPEQLRRDLKQNKLLVILGRRSCCEQPQYYTRGYYDGQNAAQTYVRGILASKKEPSIIIKEHTRVWKIAQRRCLLGYPKKVTGQTEPKDALLEIRKTLDDGTWRISEAFSNHDLSSASPDIEITEPIISVFHSRLGGGVVVRTELRGVEGAYDFNRSGTYKIKPGKYKQYVRGTTGYSGRINSRIRYK